MSVRLQPFINLRKHFRRNVIILVPIRMNAYRSQENSFTRTGQGLEETCRPQLMMFEVPMSNFFITKLLLNTIL